MPKKKVRFEEIALTRRFIAAWLALAIAVVLLALAIQNHWQENIALARRNFAATGHDATVSDLGHIETAMRSIYENIRILSQLPSIREIDRHATNMGDEARITFQQIYNNLAANVDVSEVYIVPVDLDPKKIDPVTLKSEEPILMYDQLILNAGNGMTLSERRNDTKALSSKTYSGPPEIETFEYTQLMEHAAWLKSHFPTTREVDGLNIPFISGSEIITCDNTQFITTHKNADRSGVMFSVPFYANDGKIRGMITAIILTKALRGLLLSDHFALVNPGNNYSSLAAGTERMVSSRDFLNAAKPDPSLIYSEALELSVKDSRSPWFVWSGLSNDAFYNSADVLKAKQSRNSSFMILGAIAILAAICMYLLQRNLSQARQLNESLARGRKLAEQSEAEARGTSTQLHILNEDIGRLNGALSQKVKQLTEAQDDIVRKGKMAQLGSLVATVAHELRNPLGGLRTTTFMLQRLLKESPIDVKPQLRRMETGITRCDNIISQLLDFSRTQPFSGSEIQISTWLQTLLEEEVAKLPTSVTVRLNMTSDDIVGDCDPERLRRALLNLITNAADAMVGKGAKDTGREPEIIVTLNKAKRGIELSVADNGSGIPPEILTKVGEPLFTTKSFGTGLGIAAVQKIAELHLGGLDIHSVEGHGAIFTIWFPEKNVGAMVA
jgi:signal transduction histidine kinase